MTDSPLQRRAKDIPEAMKAPATNLTLGSGFIAGIGAIVLAWNEAFEKIFGKDASESTRKDVLIAVIFAFALIAAADMFSRAIAASAHERGVGMVAAAGLQHPGVAPIFPGIPATITTGTDRPGYIAIVMRTDVDDRRSYLLIKGGRKPQWVAEDDVELGGPPQQ